MTEVNPVNLPGAPSLKQPAQHTQNHRVIQKNARPPDEAKFSESARQLSKLFEQGVNTAQINRIQKEIAEGRYDPPEKLEIAIDRLLEVEGLMDR